VGISTDHVARKDKKQLVLLACVARDLMILLSTLLVIRVLDHLGLLLDRTIFHISDILHAARPPAGYKIHP
jgi:hypothetical protein